MHYGILGSGTVGQTIAARLAANGHEVMIGTRHPEKLQSWVETVSGNIKIGSFADTAAFGELLFNATTGSGSIEALRQSGESNLEGKILIDIANPLDFSHGMPPSLYVGNTDSLGEQIQRRFPGLRVVKTLNTLNALLMVNPEKLAGGDHTLFVCGNDPKAKTQVQALLRTEFGWNDILDVGQIDGARALEAMLPLWIRLFGQFGSPMFQFKVVR